MTDRPGALCLDRKRCRFAVWAPGKRIELHLLSPRERWISMEPQDRGYHEAVVDDAPPGTLYRFRIDGRDERPDPASRFQPQGVHGPSQVVAPDFPWTDSSWKGRALQDYVISELHVGTFTPEGTFEAAVPHLDALRDLGITAVELMPVAQFPGTRNWGYDGTYPFAVQDSYGGPEGLKRFVDACHARGLAAILDVVYNHLGPEGNYLWAYAPYFTDRYKTPWGWAVNYDGEGSDEVRRYFIDNALMWVREFHVDALRLDAVHAIMDASAYPFLQQLGDEVHAAARDLHRPVHVIAESDRNDPRLVRLPGKGGYALDGVWNDDFHHALHVLLTGEKHGYYEDFGTLEQMTQAMAGGFVYTGQYSTYRGRSHGASSLDVPPDRMVIFAQNHDQIGNRMMGDRLSTLLPFEKLKLAAGVLLLSPGVPLLFMGEEYGETAPFLYFVSHGDPALIEAVRRGRKEEFAKFRWAAEPPDPQDEGTFRRSVLNRALQPRNRALRDFQRALLELRRGLPPQASVSREGSGVIVLRRGDTLAAFNFSDREAPLALPAGTAWKKELESSEARWHGPGGRAPEALAPTSFVLYTAGKKTP